MGRIIRMIVSSIFILVGAALFFYPDVLTEKVDSDATKSITIFEETYPGSDTKGEEQNDALDALWKAIEEYNRGIYENGQEDFKDAWSYEQAPIKLDGLEGDVFGYINIPAMDIEYPLYLGASSTNMLKGAAILGETSIPVGGENTNSVIAGHRGYSGIPFFRNIENLSPGDPVYITNPWGTLGYRVESIQIINPTDIDAVKIQRGRDMITLLTCHPYRSSGPYRYLVYCIRDKSLDSGETEEKPEVEIKETTVEISNSSSKDIEMEQRIRQIGKILIVAILIITVIRGIRNWRKNKVRSDVPVRRKRRR